MSRQVPDQKRLPLLARFAEREGLSLTVADGVVTLAHGDEAPLFSGSATGELVLNGEVVLVARDEAIRLDHWLADVDYPIEPDLLLVQHALWSGLRIRFGTEEGASEAFVEGASPLRWPRGQRLGVERATSQEPWPAIVNAMGDVAGSPSRALVIDFPPLVSTDVEMLEAMCADEDIERFAEGFSAALGASAPGVELVWHGVSSRSVAVLSWDGAERAVLVVSDPHSFGPVELVTATGAIRLAPRSGTSRVKQIADRAARSLGGLRPLPLRAYLLQRWDRKAIP